MADDRDLRGSMWRRWDPHIHGPGTVLNDQYRGADPWEDFLGRIENSDPPIRALGITDYYSLDVYEVTQAKRAQGRLRQIGLIFPNVEMRYGVGTGKSAPINVHLLISPEDPDHVDQTRRFLRALTFEAYEDVFRCDRDELIRLGRRHDPQAQDERAAFATGANQFKVSPDQLREAWRANGWIRNNALIAVAVGSQDGTAGLQGDPSLATLRREIEKMAHVIFSGQPKQRDFWLGRGAVSVAELVRDWNGRKPCLHGSDAHGPAAVGAPALDRLCWIKGDLTFESLRQACLEPETRTHIGSTPPRGALPSQVITSVSVTNAPWLASPKTPLNPGLVGIIGARGSGKTALADIIAAGGYALSPHLSPRSFIQRAKPLLGDSAAELAWEDGAPTSNQLRHTDLEDFFDEPRVRYLSQQFVDTLCSAEGVTDELLAEIERVIFEAHPSEDRLGAANFRELLDLRVARGRTLRRNHEAALAETAAELNLERERRANLPVLQRRRSVLVETIKKDRRDRTSLIGKGGEARARRLDEVATAAEAIRLQVEQARRRRQALIALKDEVADMRKSKAPLRLRQLQQTHGEAGLSAQAWEAFELRFAGDVDDVLAEAFKAVDAQIATLSGPAVGEVVVSPTAPPSITPLISDTTVLGQQTLSLLDKEVARLRRLIGIDAENAKAFARLSEKISRDEAAVAKLDRDIEVAQTADERIKTLLQIRRENYASVFDGVVDEEKGLSALYEPLKARLSAEDGALGKLSFVVRRTVDVAGWAAHGENFIDLRTTGFFKGRGALLDVAKAKLLPAWERGTSDEVAAAMAAFRHDHERAILDQGNVDRGNPAAVRAWAADVAAWLYSTRHVKIAYSVQYEGVDIEQLSPGTRGIVLLLLYLAIDRDDDRPLIIDQPEENLDPKSIYEELVARFRRAKTHRQIIIVTHNANLIVNTDADQVIVAGCGPHRPGELPQITYESGGLENPDIRRRVCEILEGGETAFRERARRLRVRL